MKTEDLKDRIQEMLRREGKTNMTQEKKRKDQFLDTLKARTKIEDLDRRKLVVVRETIGKKEKLIS